MKVLNFLVLEVALYIFFNKDLKEKKEYELMNIRF